jgi:hypothetical protein
MKTTFISRRQREPHQNEKKQKEPFFSKASQKQSAPFFKTSGSEGAPVQRVPLATPVEDEKLSTAEARVEKDKYIQEKPPPSQTPTTGALPEKEEKKPVQRALPEKKEEMKPMQRQPAGKKQDEKEKIQTKPNSHAATPAKSKGTGAVEKSLVFPGSTPARDALLAVGNAEAAARHGDCSLAQLVMKLSGNKLPPAGATITGEGCHFQILATNGHTATTIRIIGPKQ